MSYIVEKEDSAIKERDYEKNRRDLFRHERSKVNWRLYKQLGCNCKNIFSASGYFLSLNHKM